MRCRACSPAFTRDASFGAASPTGRNGRSVYATPSLHGRCPPGRRLYAELPIRGKTVRTVELS
jgi:hypothetical protein